MMTKLVSKSLIECDPHVAVEAFNVGFSGYLVAMAMTLEKFERRFRAENLDPFASRIWFRDGLAAALLLITRRGRTSRIGAIGVAPALRRQGLGRFIGQWAIDHAEARGDAELWLEVLDGNVAALHLYRELGFLTHSQLLGFRCDPGFAPGPGDAHHALAISIEQGVALGCRAGTDVGLPWSLQTPTLAASLAPTRCFANGTGEIVMMVDDTADEVRVTGLMLSGGAEGAGPFMRAMKARYPGRTWIASPIFTEGFAERFFAPSGWLEAEHRQLQMVYSCGTSTALDLNAS